MNPSELVTNEGELLRLRAQCEDIIDSSKRLPDVVFRRPFARYFVVEYAHVYRPTFVALLRGLSGAFGDDSVNYMMLDPDPWEGVFYGLVSFVPSTLPDRYVEVMRPGLPGSSQILAGANLGVFWGSSLKWGVFADRISWELAVIAVQKDIDVSGILGWPCFTSEQVREYMTSQYHAKDPSDSIAGEFNRKFLANYSI